MKVREAYRTPNRLDQKESPHHIITPDFSMETMKVRRYLSGFMQTLRDNRRQHRLLYSAKLSITIDRENNIFNDKNDFSNT